MSKSVHSKKALALILAKYKLEAKALKFQLAQVNKIIKDLKSEKAKRKTSKTHGVTVKKGVDNSTKVGGITTVHTAPKKRGRPSAKSKTGKIPNKGVVLTKRIVEAIVPAQKKRSHPEKRKTAIVSKKVKRGRSRKREVELTSAPKKRGRPAKAKSKAIQPKRKRGRPRKIDLEALVAMAQKNR